MSAIDQDGLTRIATLDRITRQIGRTVASITLASDFYHNEKLPHLQNIEQQL
jgi:hypothetical protein